jgi:hypothetical protein
MDTVSDAAKRIGEAMGPGLDVLKPQPVAADPTPGEAPVKAKGDVRDPSGMTSGRSRSSVAFVATTGGVTFASYAAADIGNLVAAMDGFQNPKAKGPKPSTADTVPVIAAVGLSVGDMGRAIQAGDLAPIAVDVLHNGLVLAQTGGFDAIFVEADTKVQHAGNMLDQYEDQLQPDERQALTLNQSGIAFVATYASDMKDKAEDALTGAVPATVTLLGGAPEEAPPQAAPLPKRAITRKDVSRDTVDFIQQAMAGSQPKPAGVHGTCGKRSAQVRDRRDLILKLASDFMGSGYAAGNAAKRKLFEEAMKAASSKNGISLADPRFKDVIAYLKQIVAQNPSMTKMIQIGGGALRIRAPKDLFSKEPRVSQLIGLTHMLAKGDPAKQAIVRDFFLAAGKPGGVDLKDPKYGDLAKAALAIISSNPTLFRNETLVEKNGKVSLSLSGDEMKDLAGFFDFMASDKHSEAANKVLGAQNEAVTALNTSIEASASVVVALNLLHALAGAGLAPMPLDTPGEAHPAQAGPEAVPEHGGDTTTHHTDDGPQGMPAPAAGGKPAGPRTVLPPAAAAKTASADTAHQDLLTAMRNADASLAQTRAERLRSEKKRDADIRAEAERADRDYDTALAKQRQKLDALAKETETAGVAKVQQADGSAAHVAVDRRNRVKSGESPVND